MCGIVGSISWNSLPLDLSKKIIHRGPDDFGVFDDGLVHFEHRRLSIIDTSQRGHQPMRSKDGIYTIIYNGEIYNYKSLQKDLQLKGYAFESESDTETLLYGYVEYGSDVLNKLNGIFAFAIYDKNRQEVFIARDQFGIKPLYYYHKDGLFLFGSEIKSFLSHPQFDRSVNYEALFNYIQFMYCPGEITPFLHVKRLEAGHYMTVSIKSESVRVHNPVSYFKIPFNGECENRTEDDWINSLEEHLLKAVSSQLLSDVPLGFFLSGGLDSSLLVAMATKINNGQAPSCFTISTGEAMQKEGFSDDLGYARQVANLVGSRLNVIDTQPEILKDFDKMIWHLDEPQADPSAIHVMNISKGARDIGIKVLLGGTAGDDIFTGYRRHIALNYENLIQTTPLFLRKSFSYVAHSLASSHPKVRRLKKISREIALEPLDRMAGYFTWISSKNVFELFKPEIASNLSLGNISTGYLKSLLSRIPLEKDNVNQMLFLEMSTFLTNHNLNYTDKMSMAVGVETRVPYLDIDLVKLSTKIPSNFKLRGNTTKYLLKKVAERYLPKNVIYRPKTGFGAPVREWVKEDLSEMINDRLSEQTIKKRGFLSSQAVSRLLQKNNDGLEDNAYPIMALLAIESWFEQFIDN